MISIILTAALWELTFPEACVSSGWQFKCSHCSDLPNHIKISKYSVISHIRILMTHFPMDPVSQWARRWHLNALRYSHSSTVKAFSREQHQKQAMATENSSAGIECESQLCTLPPPLPKGLQPKMTAFKGLGYPSNQSLGLFWSSCYRNPTCSCPQWHLLGDMATGQRNKSVCWVWGGNKYFAAAWLGIFSPQNTLRARREDKGRINSPS